MKKYITYEEKKVKCPKCGYEEMATVEVESVVKSLSIGPWVDIKKAVYDIDDEIFFSDVDNPIQPHHMHRVRFVNKQGQIIPETKIYTNRSFNNGDDPGPIGCRFKEPGIWQLTQNNVENGIWKWQVELKEGEIS